MHCLKIHDYLYLHVWVHSSNNTFKRVFTPHTYVKCAAAQNISSKTQNGKALSQLGTFHLQKKRKNEIWLKTPSSHQQSEKKNVKKHLIYALKPPQM